MSRSSTDANSPADPPRRRGRPAGRTTADGVIADRSMLRDEEQALDNLRRGLSELSKMRAKENVALVRELGRKKTAEFIRNWLLASYDDAASYRIEVTFADETEVHREVSWLSRVRRHPRRHHRHL